MPLWWAWDDLGWAAVVGMVLRLWDGSIQWADRLGGLQAAASAPARPKGRRYLADLSLAGRCKTLRGGPKATTTAGITGPAGTPNRTDCTTSISTSRPYQQAREPTVGAPHELRFRSCLRPHPPAPQQQQMIQPTFLTWLAVELHGGASENFYCQHRRRRRSPLECYVGENSECAHLEFKAPMNTAEDATVYIWRGRTPPWGSPSS